MKNEIVTLLNACIDLAELYERQSRKIKSDESLTDTGKKQALDRLKANKGSTLEALTSRIAELIKQATDYHKDRFLKMAQELYASDDFSNTLQAWKVSEPSREVITAIAEKYKDNPIARQELKNVLQSGDLKDLMPSDERAYYFDLMDKAFKGFTAINRNSLDLGAVELYTLPIELASRKEFFEERLDDNLYLKA